MPHALNPKVYYVNEKVERNIDIGFVGAKYPKWIGDQERNKLIKKVESISKSFNISNDIRLGIGNLQYNDWARMLANSKITIGGEAGSYYLDRNGEMREINGLKLFII